MGKNIILKDAIGHTANNTLISRNIRVNGKRTTVRLEPFFWDELQNIASAEDMTPHDLCTFIFENKPQNVSLSSTLRVLVASYTKCCLVCDHETDTKEKFVKLTGSNISLN